MSELGKNGPEVTQILVKLVSGELVCSHGLTQDSEEILQLVKEVVVEPVSAGSYLAIPKSGKSKVFIPRDQIRYVWVKDAHEPVLENVLID